MSSVDRWLAQHAAGETALAKSLAKFFKAQERRILESIGDDLTPEGVKAAIDEAAETDLLLKAISDPLIGFMAAGASRVLREANKKPRTRKAFDFGAYKLPERVETAIATAFEVLAEQDYWKQIQSTTTEVITDILADGIKDGLSGAKLSKQLRETIAGINRIRATAIARTEVTAAYGAGHQAGYEELAAEGDISGKQWLAVVDGDTRETHVDANGQEVAVNEDFTVGGDSAPYPGHASLSAKERINCRCTSVGVFSD